MKQRIELGLPLTAVTPVVERPTRMKRALLATQASLLATKNAMARR